MQVVGKNVREEKKEERNEREILNLERLIIGDRKIGCMVAQRLMVLSALARSLALVPKRCAYGLRGTSAVQTRHLARSRVANFACS